MKNKIIIKIGAIVFFIGLICAIISFNVTYPIHMSDVNEKTFTQFYPLIWPAIIFLSVGIFLIGFYTKKKAIKAICSSLIPLICYSYKFFFSYVPSSDCGNVRSMFVVFQKVGINSDFVSYFQYPTYFTLNEMTHQIMGINVNEISFLYFTLYGLLLGLFLFLFYFHIDAHNYPKTAFLYVLIFFIGMFSFLNYQWVPQTLALVLFFILLYLSNFILSSRANIELKLLLILFFVTFVFTHAFLPIIFLMFFGFILIKKRNVLNVFLILFSIYLIVLIYYTTYHLPIFIETFRQSISGLGGDFSNKVSQSFQQPQGFLDQVISLVNRLRIPMIWLVVTFGLLILFLKKKNEPIVFFLGLSGGLYFSIGLAFSVLGFRSLQILFIPLVTGISYFLFKIRRPTLIFVTIILILSVFGTMRLGYDETHFLLTEDVHACEFLSINSRYNADIDVAVGQVDWGYFKNLYRYHNGILPSACRSGHTDFYKIFNLSMEKNGYVIYNPNLGKEILGHGMKEDDFFELKKNVLLNNKIFDSNKTFILNGIHEKY